MSKRVVLILSSFPQLSETFIVSKFLGLLEKGWDVHIVCGKVDEGQWRHFPQLRGKTDIQKRVLKNWPVRPVWLAALLFPFALLRCFLIDARLTSGYLQRGWSRFGLNILKRFYVDAPVIALKPNLVHFEFGATVVGRADLGILLGCKQVVSFRGYDLNFSGLDQPDYYADVWKYTDEFHFLGEDLHKRAVRRGLTLEKPYTLIPPAIDTAYFTPQKKGQYEIVGTAERPLRILGVGRLEWKKGYEFAFQAVRLLLEKGICCEYRIIGAGNYLEPLAFARHQLNLESTVTFIGAQPREKVKEELVWADVFLHAAVSEGFCNAVLESQVMQVPVVCSDADGLPENVEDGVTGFVVPRRDPQALAEKLEILAGSPELREKMGKAGRERVEKYFQLDDQVQKFEEFYHRVLQEK